MSLEALAASATRQLRGLLLSGPALSDVHLTALHSLPSFVASQGAGCDIDEYLSRLRRLRWQAMAVRGEEDESMATQQVCVGSMQAVCDL